MTAGGDGAKLRAMQTENFHDTPPEIYAALVKLFGEDTAKHDPTVSWVDVGAGNVRLIFFPVRGRVYDQAAAEAEVA